MSQTLNLARRLKNKHVRNEFLDRRRIANNITQRVQTEFPHKKSSCVYDEMEPNTRRIFQGSIRNQQINNLKNSQLQSKNVILWLDIYQNDWQK